MSHGGLGVEIQNPIGVHALTHGPYIPQLDAGQRTTAAGLTYRHTDAHRRTDTHKQTHTDTHTQTC